MLTAPCSEPFVVHINFDIKKEILITPKRKTRFRLAYCGNAFGSVGHMSNSWVSGLALLVLKRFIFLCFIKENEGDGKKLIRKKKEK